jgi:hypothetical protein
MRKLFTTSLVACTLVAMPAHAQLLGGGGGLGGGLGGAVGGVMGGTIGSGGMIGGTLDGTLDHTSTLNDVRSTTKAQPTPRAARAAAPA